MLIIFLAGATEFRPVRAPQERRLISTSNPLPNPSVRAYLMDGLYHNILFTLLQLVLLNLGLDVHRKNAPESLMPFQAHLDQRFAEMKTSIEKDYGIAVRSAKQF